jgi:hypothetical protein
MKTPLQNDYLDKLANLNDQLCFFLFNRDEFKSKISNFTSNANSLFTTDLFAKNQYSSKIHVTFKKLPEFMEHNQTLNFGAYFSFSYEFLSGYIEDVMSIIETINGVDLADTEQKKDLEIRLNKLVVKCGQGTLPSELIDTISYFRLRRNYFTHILDTLNNKFLALVENRGSILNTYWTESISELDFSQQSVNEFKENETIELIKIIRIVLETLDTFIGGILDKEGIAKYVTTELYAGNPSRINRDVLERRKSRVSSVAFQKFGIRLTDTQMLNAISTIGCR